MQRLIQKLSLLLGLTVLMVGAATPLAFAAPDTADTGIQMQNPGTCFVHQLGTTAVKIVDCKSLGYSASQTDSAGHILDYTNCYDISGTTSTFTINKVACDDTSQGTATVMCSENGKTVACPPDTTDPAASSGNCANVNHCDLISKYINPFVNLLAALVGIGVVISIVIAGIQYGSSAGDAQKVAAAKARIRNAVIALVTFVFLYALLNFLIPGGLV
ncbi:MAG TPA: pilin [Candidatus Saccharimonadales bacterium]|nr:pilin [Candidatus Saccharimonadales bacterium]